MLDYIRDGKADIALGYLTITDKRKSQGINFSRPYHYASELLVSHADAPELADLDTQVQQRIYMRPSSAYWDTGKTLQQKMPQLALVAAPEDKETELILDDIAEKKYEFTIADSHIVNLRDAFSR